MTPEAQSYLPRTTGEDHIYRPHDLYRSPAEIFLTISSNHVHPREVARLKIPIARMDDTLTDIIHASFFREPINPSTMDWGFMQTVGVPRARPYHERDDEETTDFTGLVIPVSVAGNIHYIGFTQELLRSQTRDGERARRLIDRYAGVNPVDIRTEALLEPYIVHSQPTEVPPS